jgi:hypothetical protein
MGENNSTFTVDMQFVNVREKGVQVSIRVNGHLERSLVMLHHWENGNCTVGVQFKTPSEKLIVVDSKEEYIDAIMASIEKGLSEFFLDK